MSITRRAFGRVTATGLVGVLSGAGAPGTGGAQPAKTEIVIGYTISQTGKFSTEALDVQRAYEQWRDEVNAAGGLLLKEHGRRLPVKFVAYDDKSDASQATKLYERLITVDNAELLLAPWGSGINFAVTAITEKYGFPLLLTSASSDSIYARGFKRIFLASALASRDAIPAAEYLGSAKDTIKTVAVLYENFIFCETVFNSFMKLIDGKGVQIAMSEKYPLGAQNFLGLLTKAKSLNPDAVVVFNVMPSSIYITRQMHEVGLRPKLYMVLLGPMFKEFMELGAQAEGVAENGFWHPSLPYKGAAQFSKEFERRFQRSPSIDAAHAYAATAILTQAIDRAGTLDRNRLTEVLHRDQFETVLGPFKYDAAGINVLEKQFFVQVQDGRRTIVWPKDMATSTVRLSAFGR